MASAQSSAAISGLLGLIVVRLDKIGPEKLRFES